MLCSTLQCHNISAAELVEDVKMGLSGRLPPSRHRSPGQSNNLPPPPTNPPPEPPGYHGNGQFLHLLIDQIS